MESTINKFSRFLAKSPLQMVIALLECLPFKPFDMKIFCSMQISQIPKEFPGLSNLTIREGRQEDMVSLTRILDKRERFLSRFSKGDRCLLAIEGNEIVGFLWFSIRNVFEEESTNYQFVVPGNAVYSYDEFVCMEYRQKGVLSQLLVTLFGLIAKDGKESILILVSIDNKISLAAHLKNGFVVTGRILYFRLFNLRYYRILSD